MKQLNWYQIFGQTHTIPDGRTVTPTDDIQIWLNCANIWDKAYTTLAEVLADTDTLSALIASENAVDYIVRSTTWAVSAAIVPKMTSNTAPSGVCSASSNYSADYPAFRVFDGIPYTSSNNSRWVSASGSNTNQWLQYKFTSAVKIEYVRIQQLNTSGTGTPKNMKVQASNDGVAWTDIATYVNTDITFDVEIPVSIETSYQYYRLVMVDTVQTSPTYIQLTGLNFYSASITTNSTAMSYIGLNNYCANTLLADSTWCEAICNSEYFESVLNVKVPVMTSDTTPSGIASMTGTVINPAWRAFDENLYSTGTASGVQRLAYEFESPMCAILIKWVPYQPDGSQTFNAHTMTFAGSNDGNTWTALGSKSVSVSDKSKLLSLQIPNTTKYKHYSAMPNTTTFGAYSGICELQFYGRKDV